MFSVVPYFAVNILVSQQGQYVDGLRAPLNIHPQKEIYSYDAEYTVILGDWYHDEHEVLLEKFINIRRGAEPVPSACQFTSTFG